MITMKDPGVISCQQPKKDGPIRYSDELPNDCRISKCLKNVITPILRGLLEINPQRIISYEELFRKVREMVFMKVNKHYTYARWCRFFKTIRLAL